MPTSMTFVNSAQAAAVLVVLGLITFLTVRVIGRHEIVSAKVVSKQWVERNLGAAVFDHGAGVGEVVCTCGLFLVTECRGAEATQ